MAKPEESKYYTTWDGRTITNIELLLRDPKVQETIKKGSKSRDRGSKKGYIGVLRYRKPD